MPNSLSELHTLHAWEDNQITERCTQGEYAGKVLQFKLVDKDGAINLSNCLVQYAVTRPDKTEDLLDCTVDNGVVKCNLTYSATSISGLVHGEVRVIGSNNSGTIKFYGVNLRVYKGVSDEAVEQSDEFTALVAALQKVVSITPNPDSENTYVVRLDDSIVQNGLNPVASGVIYDYLQGNYRQISFAHENNESSYDDGGVYIDDATDITKMYYVKNSNGARVGILFCVQTPGYNYASQVRINAYGNITTRVKTQESGEADYTWKSWTPVGTTRNIQDYAVTTPKLADGAVTSDKIDASVVTRGIIYDFVTALTALDSTITENGTKPVASGVIYDYLNGNFYTKANTYTKSEINTKVSSLSNRLALHISVGFNANGVPVKFVDGTTISSGAFTNSDVTKIFISQDVQTISNGAFAGCPALSDIYFDSTSTSYDNSTIPSGVTAHTLNNYHIMNCILDCVKYLDDNKVQSISSGRLPTTEDSIHYPSVAAVKDFLYANFYTDDEVDDLLDLVYSKTAADDLFATKANTYTKSEINAIQTENDKRFELQTTVGFDENGIPVFISDNNSFSAGSCTVNNIKTLFIGSNVRLLQSGAFTTNSTDIEVVFIDNEQSGIAIQSGALPDGATIYYKGQFNALGFVIAALKNLSTSKLDDANNSVKTNHIANLNVTEGKLSSELQAKINKKTGVYSYTIPASNWSNNAQSLNLSSVYTVTSNTKVDIEADDTALNQLSIDDCEGIYVENNNGTLTVKAIANSPTANITVQLVVYEVETLS